MELDQELAQRLLVEGSTCVCLGVAKGTEFGIDMKTWTTAEKFLGVKMIPPGFHYVHYSMSNPHGDKSPKAGFIWFSNKSEIIVKKWNEMEGLFENESEETANKLKCNLRDIDKNLGAYPYDVWSKWTTLTNKITPALATKFVPNTGVISSVLELNGATDTERKSPDSGGGPLKRQRRSAPFSDVDTYGNLLPNLQATEGTELRFSNFPENCYPPGSSPQEITKHSLDSSFLLGLILDQHDKPDDILAELQFSFVAFLVGHSMEGFEQWKRLLGVLCSVQEGLAHCIPLYSDLLTMLKPQLEEIPLDFLVDIVASSNFVYQSLRKLFRNIYNECDNSRLQSKAKRLQEFLTETFLWDFSDVNEDDEDEQPVVVVM